MEPSKVTVNYFRKKLRSQKRKTVLMFFIGLLLGGAIVFNLYFWYPLLQKKFDLPGIPQIGKIEKKVTTTSSSSTDSSTKEKETVGTSETKEETLQLRTDPSKFTKVNPKYENLQKQLEDTISQYNISGTILAVKDNEVVLHNNYGKALEINTKPIESTYMIASIQKLITGILVMSLIDEGKLDLNTPLSTYYPEIPNSENITIDQMLSMTSGLRLKDKSPNATSREESINFAVKNVVYEPLDKWQYSDVNFFFLGAIIEKVSGTTYEMYFEKKIKDPLKLEHTGFYDFDNHSSVIPSYTLDDSGVAESTPVPFTETNIINELGTGNMYVSTGDLLMIIQGLFDSKLVSKETIKSTFIRNPAAYSYTYKSGLYDETSNYYGHGVFRGYEPTIYMDKDASSGVIFLSNIHTQDKRNINLTSQLYQQLKAFNPTSN